MKEKNESAEKELQKLAHPSPEVKDNKEVVEKVQETIGRGVFAVPQIHKGVAIYELVLTESDRGLQATYMASLVKMLKCYVSENEESSEIIDIYSTDFRKTIRIVIESGHKLNVLEFINKALSWIVSKNPSNLKFDDSKVTSPLFAKVIAKDFAQFLDDCKDKFIWDEIYNKANKC